MTNEEARAIGERLKKCDGFRWLPGMANMRGEVCVAVNPGRKEDVAFGDCFGTIWESSDYCVPDVREPRTRGGLLALVREAFGDPRKTVFPVNDGTWCMEVGIGFMMGRGSIRARGATEAEALVAALEAAPSKGAA